MHHQSKSRGICAEAVSVGDAGDLRDPGDHPVSISAVDRPASTCGVAGQTRALMEKG
jgi:hypothetical protein